MVRVAKPKTCAQCPKRRLAVCLIRGRVMLANHPACDAGIVYMRRAAVNRCVRKWREKQKAKEVQDGQS